MKVVINKCFGGFSLSYEAVMAYGKRKGIPLHAYVNPRNGAGDYVYRKYVPYNPLEHGNDFLIYYVKGGIENGVLPDDDRYFDETREFNGEGRADPDLVAVVEELGQAANGHYARLKVVEIPDGVKWEISEYDGRERVEQVHESWG